jgi:hypothetical protein
LFILYFGGMIFLKPMRNSSREWAWVNAELGNILAKITPFFALGRSSLQPERSGHRLGTPIDEWTEAS